LGKKGRTAPVFLWARKRRHLKEQQRDWSIDFQKKRKEGRPC